MTNEEAIKTLEVMRAEVEWESPVDYAAAIDDAIEALRCRTHSCENCGYGEGCKVAEFLMDNDLRTDDICCEEWEEIDEP